MSAAAGYPLAVPQNVVGGVGQGPGPNPVAYGTMPGQPPNGATGAYGQAPGPMQQHHMQYSYAPNPAMDQYGMQIPYGHMNGTNYGSMIPTSMSTIKTEGPTSIYDPRNSYSYTPMDNGANGMGPPQQMAMRQQYSMQPQSMSSPMHPQMMPQMMQTQQQQRVNCQPNCSTASVSVASPMTHTSMHQQPTVQSPGGNRTPSYMTKAAKNQHPQQSPSHPSVNTPNMMGAQQQQTCSSISNSLGSGITLSHLQSPPQAQNGGGPARILIHSSHSVQLNSPAPASTPPTPHLSHPPLQQTYQAMVKDEPSQQQQQQACARPGTLPSPPSADSSFTTVTHYEMPAAMQNMKEQFKRCNPRLVQYYDSPRRQLRTPYPVGNHVPAPKEPPTFAFLHGTKFYELQYERRIPPSQGMEQHISMGPPMVPPPLNRSQSMHASMMPTQFAPAPQQAAPTQQTGSSKPAPKKSRSVSDADHFHNPMMAANQQNQQMMANMQPGNGQMQQQAQPHYMPHMGQQPQQQMNSSYQMPPLNRSMSAGYMMTGGNQMVQQNMMQGQQGMPQMHQMDMNQARYGAPQNGPMSSQPQQQQQQQQQQKPQQQQPMMMQSQQPTPQSYSNPGSQQNVQHTQQQIEYYCSGCMNPIQQNQPYIRCNGDASCRRVFHRECSRLTPEAASRLEMESSTCKWVCDNCASLAIR